MAQPTHFGRRIANRRDQRGLATLIVVMLLFFIVALVAAYASRNLVFEQRTSANQYRSTQALEAAEAGMQWTLAMLNSGRVDNSCQPVANQTQASFRARYIDKIDEKRRVSLVGSAVRTAPFLPRCAFNAGSGQWTCICANTNANILPTVAGNAQKPFFRIRFDLVTGREDVMRIESVGCTRPDTSCLDPTAPRAPDGDAMAIVTSLVALRSGLSTPPFAAVTAEGSINGGASAAGQGPLTAINNNPGSVKFPGTNGVTFVAGDTTPAAITGNITPIGLPGSPGNLSLRPGETTLAGLQALAGPPAHTKSDRLFSLVFGMWPATYQAQPSVIQMPCGGGCTASQVNAKALQFPGHAIWIDGDLTVNGNIGSVPASADPTAESVLTTEVAPTGPVLLIVTGNLTLTSGTVVGLVYHRSTPGTPDWDLGSGTTSIRGALITEGNIFPAGQQTVTYDAAVLNRLHSRFGTYVRVPGGWRDF
jgi:Tfp pilus assembly protein PilX